MIPCDGPEGGSACDEMLAPTQDKCPKCGTEYDVDDAPLSEPERAAAAPPPESEPERTAAAPPSTGADAEGKCVLCDSGPVINGTCQACGMDQSDDQIPF